ncbi:UNVERIFIED_CONTAM: Citrate synthase 2, peroxisomal [Sesamum latifolium]|uniref:Citrate synthase 2, peroxisomal n=1 Tax=Sesamum latifolium TaxID=2727402 RepID=A0AAW2XV72_9LAMI
MRATDFKKVFSNVKNAVVICALVVVIPILTGQPSVILLRAYQVFKGYRGITTGKDDKGLKLYDPGYLNTAPVRSSICYIDGDEGILRYTGYPIEEMTEGSSFLEVAYHLSKNYTIAMDFLCVAFQGTKLWFEL